jgi:hypothetical protein
MYQRQPNTLRFLPESKGFLEVVDRKESQRRDMWKARAKEVDVVARWTIPSGFVIFIAVLYHMGEESLDSLASSEAADELWGLFQSTQQLAFYAVGMLPLTLVCVGACAIKSMCCCKKKPRGLAPQSEVVEPTLPGSASKGDVMPLEVEDPTSNVPRRTPHQASKGSTSEPRRPNISPRYSPAAMDNAMPSLTADVESFDPAGSLEGGAVSSNQGPENNMRPVPKRAKNVPEISTGADKYLAPLPGTGTSLQPGSFSNDLAAFQSAQVSDAELEDFVNDYPAFVEGDPTDAPVAVAPPNTAPSSPGAT